MTCHDAMKKEFRARSKARGGAAHRKGRSDAARGFFFGALRCAREGSPGSLRRLTDASASLVAPRLPFEPSQAHRDLVI